MKVEQIYTGCLAEAAYYIESNGEAAIIDPLRETAPYVEMAEKNGATIKYILETHFHADFVSGHLDLAAKTGAAIVYGPNADPNFDIHSAKDGEILPLGNVNIKVLHTPGHTMESTTYLLLDEEGKEHSIYSGDTLFIGDVGRPDLAIKTDLSREDLAGHLFDSLRTKIMTLPDEVIVYPGHGAGSACGKNLSSETFDTLGNQKKTNYALREDMTREEFVREVTDGLLPPPAYFPKNAMMNKMGYESFEEVLKQGTQPIPVDLLEKTLDQTGAMILDTRSEEAFGEGHIPRSIFIGIDGNFAPWVGALIPDLKQAIVVIAEPGREEEVVTRLSRVGYDNCVGYLDGGFEAWKAAGREFDTMTTVSAAEVAAKVSDADFQLLDARKPTEFTAEHIEGAVNFPLDYINTQMDQVRSDGTYYLHCLGGYRSVIAISILKSRGYHNFLNVAGGFRALKESGAPVTDYVCPTTV